MILTCLRSVSSDKNRLSTEEFVYDRDDFLWLASVIDTGPQFRAVLDTVSKVSSELLHLTRAVEFVAVDQHTVISSHHFITIVLSRLRVSTGRQILFNLAEDPGIG